MQLNSQSEAIILKGIASQIMQMNVPNLLQVNNMLAHFELEIYQSNSLKGLDDMLDFYKEENRLLKETIQKFQISDNPEMILWNEEVEIDMLSAANSVDMDHIRS